MSELNDFVQLKAFLIAQGITLGEAHGYTPIAIGDVIFGKNSNIEIGDDDNFYVLGTDGIKHRVFLYKRDYHLEEFGKPRAHIHRCQTIQQFINQGNFTTCYRYANTNKVKVRDVDNGMKEVVVEDLPLCKYCQRESNIKSVNAFVEELKKEGLTDVEHEVEVTNDGYVRDWETISREYREKKNFTCEKCGYQANNPLMHYYMHTHHKDENKLNNRESNFQCLCIKCHSEVDEYHKQRFSTPSQQAELKFFEEHKND